MGLERRTRARGIVLVLLAVGALLAGAPFPHGVAQGRATVAAVAPAPSASAAPADATDGNRCSGLQRRSAPAVAAFAGSSWAPSLMAGRAVLRLPADEYRPAAWRGRGPPLARPPAPDLHDLSVLRV